MSSLVSLGTAESKTSGTSLTLASTAAHVGSGLLVGIGYETGAGAPTSIRWGFRELDQLIVRSQSGMATAWWILRHINNTDTRNIVATWSTAITAKVMLAYEILGANVLDVSQGNTQTATTDPGTGTSVDSTDTNTIHMALFGSRGPDTDTVGTVNLGHTSGLRVGTAGPLPASNVTIHATHKKLTAIGSCRATKTGATSRDWANVIVALKAKHGPDRYGITASDHTPCEITFEAGSLDFGAAAFWWNPAEARWEAYDKADMATMVAHQANGWT